MGRGSVGVLAGNVTAMFELLVTFLAVAALGVGLLGPTLWRAARAAALGEAVHIINR